MAERGVPGTGLIEVRRALLRWQLHRRVKDGGFPLVRFAHAIRFLPLPDKARFGKKKGQPVSGFRLPDGLVYCTASQVVDYHWSG